jgi:hypothetical protein
MSRGGAAASPSCDARPDMKGATLLCPLFNSPPQLPQPMQWRRSDTTHSLPQTRAPLW